MLSWAHNGIYKIFILAPPGASRTLMRFGRILMPERSNRLSPRQKA